MNAGHRRSETTGIILAAGAALAFGTLAVSAKYAYDEGATVLPLLAARFAIAAVLLALYLGVTGGRLWIGAGKASLLFLLGAFGYAFESTLFFLALERAPAGVVALIFYSYPLWTSIIGVASGLEPLRWPLASALLLGTVGVALIFSISAAEPLGQLLALGAAIAVAVYFTLAHIALSGVPASSGSLWTALGAAVALGAVSIVTRDPLPAAAWPWAAALGLATAVAFVALFAAMARIGAPRAAVATMLEPVTTVALAALLLGEAITARVGVGALLIVAALPILASTVRREEVPPDPDSL